MASQVSNAEVAFTAQDFRVLEIPGFSDRMSALRERLSPKLQAIGEALRPTIEQETHQSFHVHVARHARRTTNPPTDTWVALSEMRRGYKMVPHFSVGLFSDRLFVRVGALYEAPARAQFAAALQSALPGLPADAEVVFDHQRPGGIPAAELLSTPGRIAQAAGRRQGEILLERSRRAADVAGEDVVALARRLLPPLSSLYAEWRQGAQIG